MTVGPSLVGPRSFIFLGGSASHCVARVLLKPEKEIAMSKLCTVLLVVFTVAAVIVNAQNDAPEAPVVSVFVEGSIVSSFSGSGDAWGSSLSGTTEPQTIEVMKQLRRFCPGVRITSDRTTADYLILHERQAGGTFGGNRNNVAVFNRNDTLVYADGATQLDNSVEDLCESSVLR